MMNTGDRRTLAGMAVVVVLLHLAVFGALFGSERGVLIVAYLLGVRWAFDLGNAEALGGATRRLAGIGRRGVSSGFWFALGFSTTVAGLAFLFAMGAQLLAPQPAPDGDRAAVFLGILAILQIVVLLFAVRARRARRARRGPVPRPGLERLIRWVRRAWQLYPIGAFFGVGLVLAAEIALLVLAAGTATPAFPFSLALAFAAGMCLMATLRGAFAADTPPARRIVLPIVFTAVVAVGALVAAAMSLNDLRLPSNLTADALIRLVDDAQEQPAALGDYLLDRPGLLLLLLLVLVAALVFRRSRTAGRKDNEPEQAAVQRPAASRPTEDQRPVGRARLASSQSPADGQRKPSRAVAAASPQAAVNPAVQPTPYGQRVVARAAVGDFSQGSAAPGSPAASGIAIVTGAGAGVGRAVALGLAGAGYGILAVDVDGDSAAACATQARAYGVPAQAVRAELRDPLYLERIVAVAEEWGRTSVLVNAGAGGWPSQVPDLTAEMRLSGLLREPMRRRGGGAVVNVVPAASVEAASLIRFTTDSAGARDGVRVMCVATDQPVTVPAAVVSAVLDLIRRGSAGAVVAVGGAGPVRRFARGTASVG